MFSLRSVTKDVTAPYSAVEAFAYDTFLGDPAAAAMAAEFDAFVGAAADESCDVLDVGAGGGQAVVFVADRHPRARVTALDLSPVLVERAGKRLAKLGPRARAVVGSAIDLPFGDASFDAVWSMASLKHWPDQAQGLREIVRVLRPGGRFCVVEVDRGCHVDDARRFLDHLPALKRVAPLSFPALRTYVLGQGWDLDEARLLAGDLARAVAGVDVAAARLPGWPHIALRGGRR